MKTKLNAIFWLLIMLSFSLIFSYQLISGKIINYLHPKMIPFIIFADLVWILLSIYQILEIKKTKLKLQNFKLGYLMFLIPICLSFADNGGFYQGITHNKNTVFVVPLQKNVSKQAEINTENNTIVSSSQTGSEVEITTESSNSTSQTEVLSETSSAENSTEDSSILTQNSSTTISSQASETTIATTTESSSSEMVAAVAPANHEQSTGNSSATVPVITNDSFLNQIIDLQNNLEQRIGTKVTMKGFVYKTSEFKNNNFVVARLLINCCAADAGVAGIMIESEQAPNYPLESWVEVTGTVASFERVDEVFGNAYQSPILTNVTIKTIEPLATPYVYP